MRTLGGLAIGFLAVTGLVGQNRGAFVNTAPISQAGSTIYPGAGVALPRATSTNPFPAGAALSPITVPLGSASARNNGIGRSFRNRSGSTVYAYPVYIGGYGGYYGGYGGYYDPSYYTDPTTLIPQQQQASPNVTVIMPPPQPPTVINVGPGAGPQQDMSFYPPQPGAQQPPPPAPATQAASSEPPVYLIAFKDHTIYSAIAYWVDGDTLHYFTSGNTHNQVSISLIDRPLTERLNREMGVEFKLPPAK
jgi:hypothetical protein